METKNQVVKQNKETKEIEYTPFGSASPIKLSVAIIRNLVAIPTKSGAVPTDNECIKFLMLCQARELNPFEGDCFLQGYDGHNGPQFSLITAHQAFLKRANGSADFDGMESGVIVTTEDGEIRERSGDFFLDGETLLGAWARVHKKTQRIPTERRVKLKTFKKDFGVWKTNPEGMIVKCAEADALRSAYSNKLGGLYSDSELSPDDQRFVAAKPALVRSDAGLLESARVETARTIDADPHTDQESAPAPRQETQQAGPSPHEELAIWLQEREFKEQELIAACVKTGLLDSPCALGDFPDAVVKRCLLAKLGLAAEIKKARGGK